MVQKSKTTTWDVFQTLQKHGINYQPQLVSSPYFWLNHQQYSIHILKWVFFTYPLDLSHFQALTQ